MATPDDNEVIDIPTAETVPGEEDLRELVVVGPKPPVAEGGVEERRERDIADGGLDQTDSRLAGVFKESKGLAEDPPYSNLPVTSYQIRPPPQRGPPVNQSRSVTKEATDHNLGSHYGHPSSETDGCQRSVGESKFPILLRMLKECRSRIRVEELRLECGLYPDLASEHNLCTIFSSVLEQVRLTTGREPEQASSSYSNRVSWLVPKEKEGTVLQLVPPVGHTSMQHASLEQSNQRQSWWHNYDFDERDCLGAGAYGAVYKVTHRVDGVEYAMKIIKVPSSGHGEEMEKKLREVYALAKLEHPRIVRYYYSWVKELPTEWLEKGVKLNSSEQESGSDQEDGPDPPTCLFIQTELCQGTLRQWLLKTGETKMRMRNTILKNIEQILDALLYIHKEGYTHRDLTPSNIFFSLKDGSIKVGDFGFVTQCETECETTGFTTPKRSGNVGTMCYRAPEQMFGGRTYNEKVDIFALGVILFEANMFFQNEIECQVGLDALKEDRSLEMMLQEILPEFVQRLPCEAALIDLLTSYDPSERPTAKEVFQSQQWKDFQKNAGDPTNVPELDP